MKRIVFVFCSAILLCACAKQGTSSEVPPLTVSVRIIDTLTVQTEHTYMGELEDNNTFAVCPSISGKISAIEVHNNQAVHAGQVLIRMDEIQRRNVLQAAQVTLRQAEDGYKRAKKMYDNGGIAEVKLVEIETQLGQARSAVAIAEQELSNCVIKAEQDGIVTDCRCKVGQTVLPGEVLMRLVGTDALVAKISIPEDEIMHLHIGDTAWVYIPVLEGRKIESYVSEKSLIPDKISHTYEVRLRLTASDSRELCLLPGMVCRVQFVSDHHTGFLIPANCLQMRSDGLYVWAVEGDTAVRRKVSDVHYRKNAVLVGNGLRQGDVIITDGFQKMYNGAKVRTL